MSFYEWAVAREREKCEELKNSQEPLGCRVKVECRTESYGNHDRQKVRVFIPKDRSTIKGYMVNVHGGGLIAGDIYQNTNFCDWMAAVHGMVVFAVEYRLMPEVSFSTQLSDVVAAFDFIEKSLRERTKRPVYLVADSAGCHLGLIANALGQPGDWMSEWFEVYTRHHLTFDGAWLNAPMIETTGFNEIGLFMAKNWYGRSWKQKKMSFYLKNPLRLLDYLPNDKVVIITSNGDKLKPSAVKAWKYLGETAMGASLGFGRKTDAHDWNVLYPAADGYTRDMNRWAVDCLTGAEQWVKELRHD